LINYYRIKPYGSNTFSFICFYQYVCLCTRLLSNNQQNETVVYCSITMSRKFVNHTISDLSYDHLPTKFATVSQNLSECFTISDLRLEVMTSSLCEGRKIDKFTRAAHLSDKFIYSFRQNIKYSYLISLCRYVY
jgi:hypothetical protein